MPQTKVKDLIDPEVLADMISAKLPSQIKVAPFAKIDTTLVGNEGDTITVPKFAYIGDAEDVAEGEEITPSKLTATSSKVTVKKAMKAVELTDEAALTSHGDPVGETRKQLTKSIGSKVDVDCMEALVDETEEGRKIYDGSNSKISYNGIVDAIDMFDEEENDEKAIFVNPKQVTTLRKDPDFISADKYPGNVMVSGEIGKICNTRVVPSKKAKLVESGTVNYIKTKDVEVDNNKTYYILSDGTYIPVEEKNVEEIGNYYEKVTSTNSYYLNPIIILDPMKEAEEDTEDETPALTIYLKRDVNVETERHTLKRSTSISADEIYAAVVSNEAKLVLAKFKK